MIIEGRDAIEGLYHLTGPVVCPDGNEIVVYIRGKRYVGFRDAAHAEYAVRMMMKYDCVDFRDVLFRYAPKHSATCVCDKCEDYSKEHTMIQRRWRGKTMTTNEARLAAHLLNMASNEFSNHGCNDFKRPDWYPKSEWNDLLREMYEQNGDPENYQPSEYSSDDWLMSHFAGMIERNQ